MKKNILALSVIASLFVACSSDKEEQSHSDNYIVNLEKNNHINYNKISNTRGTYITSMCYTKTKTNHSNRLSNPCYSCHTKGKIPNYYNDSTLQKNYYFPKEMLKNPFSNLFKDRTEEVEKISDNEILKYVRESNYFLEKNIITLDKNLPSNWQGYRPDCYFNFDEEGFDHKPNGNHTRWRAFRYYPFLGTFFPTNGSTDDVMIRLDKIFSEDINGEFNKDIYKLNLAIVEALVKNKEIDIDSVDENLYGVDLDGDNRIESASKISPNIKSYVGKAQKSSFHLSKGLFPENTEFLHSVRYLDWNGTTETITLAPRMKELRYAKKEQWFNYSQLSRVASSELWEAQANDTTQGVMATFRGNYEKGLLNDTGWRYQGFIESKDGTLRPQTHEETIACMGCHAHLGATVDSSFSFARKFEGIDKNDLMYGWNHWRQKGLVGVKEPKQNYLNIGQKFEYSFYLYNNHSANEFRDNTEAEENFFDKGVLKEEMIEKLHNDITTLLFPSKHRALALNKAYKTMVKEQSYIYGRDANVKPMKNVYKQIEAEQATGIKKLIIQE